MFASTRNERSEPVLVKCPERTLTLKLSIQKNSANGSNPLIVVDFFVFVKTSNELIEINLKVSSFGNYTANGSLIK